MDNNMDEKKNQINSEGKGRRLKYFDLAKGIGACLVVLGHLPEAVGVQFRTWIFSFHMPFFFLISGMLICYKRDVEKDFKEIAAKRARGIMIPYLSFSVLYMMTVFAAYFSGTIRMKSVLDNLWYVVSLYGMNVLWFLPALLFGELIFIFIMQKCRTNRMAAVQIAVVSVLSCVAGVALNRLGVAAVGRELNDGLTYAGQLLVVIVRSFVAMSFVALGYFLFPLFHRREKASAAGLLTAAVLLILGVFLGRINGGVDMRSLAFRNVIFYYAAALSGSFGVLILCKSCPAFKPLSVLPYLGRNSLIVMAAHNSNTVLYWATFAAMYLNQFVTRAKGYVYALVVFLIIMLYVVLIIELINRFFPFLIGKKRTAKKSEQGK